MAAGIRLGFACGARLGIYLPHDLAHLISFLEELRDFGDACREGTGRR